MNFAKRAIMAVTRRKGKSFIMLILFLAIANMVLAGIAIQHATDSASVLARQKLGGQLTLTYNSQAAMQKARDAGEQKPTIQREPVTEEMVNTIASQQNIVDFNILVSTNGTAEGFEPVVTRATDTTDTEQTTNQDNNKMRIQGGAMQGKSVVMPDVTVTGVSSSSLTDAFSTSDGAKLIDGRHITSEDENTKVALIEKNLADQNSLKVGDKITIKATSADTTVEYTIVGIYQTGTNTSTQENNRMRNMPFTEPYNQIYVDYQSALPLKSETVDNVTTAGGIDSAVFFVDDPSNIEQVKADAQAMNIDWTKFTLDANDTAYKQMMAPIETVASFSRIVVYVVALAGALILALLLMLSIKERMYETGVLLSMGEGKLKIIGQYVLEVLMVAILAFGLSCFSGKYIAQSAGNMLIQREIQTEQQSVQNQGFNNNIRTGGMGFNRMQGRQTYQPIDSINVQITPQEVGQATGAGILILILGTILPASSIMRFKPKTILTNLT